MKRAFLIHAWGETPDSCWYSWLKRELETRGFEVFVPAMPTTNTPEIESWVGLLSELVLNPDEDTYFVGHSIGAQTILRYLERLPESTKIGGAFFVTPWMHLENLEEESKPIAKQWLETPINWERVKVHCSLFTATFSDNDPWVPPSEEKVFQEKLNAVTSVMHDVGHLDSQTKLPELLQQIEEASTKGET